MRIAVAIILFILWLVGIVGTYTIGAGVDLLLLIAVLLLLIELRHDDV